MSNINKLKGKIIFTGQIKLLTGLHIGKGGDFSAIGAVDNVVIRDALTKKPMIPGSSLKGKMRFLLARTMFESNSLQMKDIQDEDKKIKRLFGSSGGPKKSDNPDNEKGIILSRLQFHDCIMTDESSVKFEKFELDLPYTEIKYENTINRATAVANPRQQERVPAGAEFSFKLTYNIEAGSEGEIIEDIENIFNCIELLQDDYLGGHGTRGYGRVEFVNIKHEVKGYQGYKIEGDIEQRLKEKIEGMVK